LALQQYSHGGQYNVTIFIPVLSKIRWATLLPWMIVSLMLGT